MNKRTLYEYLREKPADQVLFQTDDGRIFTCGQVKKETDGLAAHLQALGMGAGKTIALRFSRTAEACIRYFALLAVGVQVYLADPHGTREDFFRASECVSMDGYLSDETGSWILTDSDGRDAVLEGRDMPFFPPPQNPEAPAILIATSGSTGEKKLVQLSQYNVAANLLDAVHFGDYRKGDLALGILPLFHIFGQALLFGSVMLDYAILFPKEVSPLSALKCIETFGVTRMNGVPSLYLAMAEQAAGFNVSSLRVGFIGGSHCVPEEIRRMEDKLGMTLLNSYGMSECISITISNARDPLKQRVGGVGRCYPRSELRIVRGDGSAVLPGETGEITVRGASRMLGYYGDEEATAAAIDGDGFLHTGDLGYTDEDGILHITGRIKDIIIRNGVNISAARVEAALRSVPGVEQAAVVGIRDSLQGEVPVAMAESKRSSEEILFLLASALPKNELPVKVYVTEKLPVTPTGKTDKQAVKKLISAWEQG